MAEKIRLKDYLSNKKKQEPIYESGESIITRIQARMDADSCVVSPAYRIANYETVEELLDQVPEFEGRNEIEQECHKRLEAAREEKLRDDYRRAKIHLREASTEYEYKRAAEEFEELESYKGSEKLKKEALQKAAKIRKKGDVKRAVILLVIAALVVCGFFIYKTGVFSYLVARLEGANGSYESAVNRFYDLGDLLDSKEQYEYYSKLYQDELQADVNTALSRAKVGKGVMFADYKWRVLDKDGTILTLMCTAPGGKSPFAHIAYGGESWETSSLREKLNGEILEKVFTPEQIAALVPMETVPGENEVYHTDGGASTTDLVRIMSAEEAQEDDDEFDSPYTEMWLCTPGHDTSSAAYMTTTGKIMWYGNDVMDTKPSACPIICVDYSRIEQQSEAQETEGQDAAE